MKKLHVKRTSAKELTENGWPVIGLANHSLYVRCDRDGKVKWDKTLLYKAEELIGRDNVVIKSNKP